jgi:hypothetical protein
MKRGAGLRLIGVGSLAAAAHAFVIRWWILAWGSTAGAKRPTSSERISRAAACRLETAQMARSTRVHVDGHPAL